MEEKQLNVNKGNFNIEVNDLKELVNKYMQREHGSDDVDFMEQRGGDDWLEKGLKTDFKNGISPETVSTREAYFGTNRKEKVIIPSLFHFMLDAFEDFMLRILMCSGILSIVLGMITKPAERSHAWIEGFAIILAIFIVVMVTAINDRKKELEFQKLNDKMESQKKVSVIRMGVEVDNMSMADVQVGDIIQLKQGLEVPGDGIIIQGFSVSLDESSMTGETKAMTKESLQKCLQKKIELEKKGIEHLSHHSIPSPVVLSGTKVITGTGSMVVINVGKNSAIGKIQEIITSGEDDMTPLQLKLEHIARMIGYFGLASSVIILVVMIIRALVNGGKESWS